MKKHRKNPSQRVNNSTNNRGLMKKGDSKSRRK
jgi:hypothetical protein